MARIFKGFGAEVMLVFPLEAQSDAAQFSSLLGPHCTALGLSAFVFNVSSQSVYKKLGF